jgi:flagellar biosynthesis GTPase FlhF
MPTIAILNDKVITVEDIYKFNIDRKSAFKCLNCDKELQFRKSRNPDNNFTEHFYHPNTLKGTHIDCESLTLERLRDNDTWHNKLSNFIENENREIIRKNNDIKHIVDAYDPLNNMGIEFQNSPISVEAIQSRDAMTELDWIFNVENQYIRKVTIGNKIICEIPHDNWENAVKAVKNTVYLYTGMKEWVRLEDCENYRVEIDGKRRHVWIGIPCLFQEIHDETCIQNIITKEGISYFQNITNEVESVPIIYARCKKSMYLLDPIHRRHVNKYIFQPNEILAIKSVAGSGKTTTLLKLAQAHPDKRILYLAFNKALITEIASKLRKHNITNLFPATFDSVLYRLYILIKKREPTIVNLTPQTIHEYVPWFKGKPFDLRKYYTNLFSNFCSNEKYHIPSEFCKYTYIKNKKISDVSILNTLWQKVENHQLITFDSIRKCALIENWFEGNIDKMYDMIMIDETQDFDMMMLQMLLKNTTIPKVFVGDTNQAIYKWRGCINAFNHLPKNTLTIEFYSTFRVGDPACEKIREKFDNCWMISKSKNQTVLSDDESILENEKYTYLFRTWRSLLITACETDNIWIHNFESQAEKMRKLHEKLSRFHSSIENDDFPDDLPMFLKSLTNDQLEELILKIEENIVKKSEAQYKFYTIHSYKGLEDDNIRICDDLEDKDGNIDSNLYYVALTRGMKKIVNHVDD